MAEGRKLNSNTQLYLIGCKKFRGKVEEKTDKVDFWINLFENKLPLKIIEDNLILKILLFTVFLLSLLPVDAISGILNSMNNE